MCDACTHADREGWWGSTIPSGFTHCRDCHETWPGSNRWGHCARCHETFNGIVAFDLHQRADSEGLLTSSCLCSVAAETADEPLSAIRQRTWQVSKSMTLDYREFKWGRAWSRPEREFV